MRLIGYMRTSTRKQNFGQQETHFRHHGLSGIPVYRDHGVSGYAAPETREGLRAALDLLDSGAADRLVVSTFCRLSRGDHAVLRRPDIICLDDLE